VESILIETLATGGPTAVLALIIFLMYRRDRNNTEHMWRESKKFTEDRLDEIIEKDQKSREENTKALTELIILLRKLNGTRGYG